MIIDHSDTKNGFYSTVEVALRRRIEASTGIDCRPFFSPKGGFQPLAARAIAEEFLESDACKMFAEDERYFFGHRIP